MPRTLQIELTYDNEISFDTVEAIMDSHVRDEGVVRVKGRLVSGEHERDAEPR